MQLKSNLRGADLCWRIIFWLGHEHLINSFVGLFVILEEQSTLDVPLNFKLKRLNYLSTFQIKINKIIFNLFLINGNYLVIKILSQIIWFNFVTTIVVEHNKKCN